MQKQHKTKSVILHHLTVVNHPIYDYIAQFINFFESDDAFYLVMERAGNINLAQFNEKAHALIADGRMEIKHWKKVCCVLLQICLMRCYIFRL